MDFQDIAGRFSEIQIEELEVDHRSTRDALARSKAERHRKEKDLTSRKKKLDEVGTNRYDGNGYLMVLSLKMKIALTRTLMLNCNNKKGTRRIVWGPFV